jgi:acyl dehydratase
MDIAAGMTASQRSHGRVATVAIDAMSFQLPVFVGDILCVYTEMIRIGTTSMWEGRATSWEPSARRCSSGQAPVSVPPAADTTLLQRRWR